MRLGDGHASVVLDYALWFALFVMARFRFVNFFGLDGDDRFAGPAEGGQVVGFGTAKFLIPVSCSRCRFHMLDLLGVLGILFMNRSNIFVRLMFEFDMFVLDMLEIIMLVLDMQGLGYRLGGGKDGFVLGKGGGQGRYGLGNSFGLNFSDRLSNWLRRGRLLRKTLVLRNRLSGQQDWLVSGRRTGRLGSTGIDRAERLDGASVAWLRRAFRTSFRTSLRTSLRTTVLSSISAIAATVAASTATTSSSTKASAVAVLRIATRGEVGGFCYRSRLPLTERIRFEGSLVGDGDQIGFGIGCFLRRGRRLNLRRLPQVRHIARGRNDIGQIVIVLFQLHKVGNVEEGIAL